MKKLEIKSISAPVIGISRFRLGTDGEGITTLVAFQGCPLRCSYCLNKECWESADHFKHYTPKELYEEVKKDDLYFRATGGGITFGGGEPALRADFIVAFRKLCGKDWKIRLETSLNVEQSLIDKLAPVVDEWIADTKAERSVAYKEYTGVYRQRFHNNFYKLIDKTKGHGIPRERITLKVHIIPGYVTEEQAGETAENFKKYQEGCKVEIIRYLDNEELAKKDKNTRERNGKRICEILKALRSDIAKRYGIDLEERDCSHKGNCAGTCPRCEADIEKLEKGLLEKLENKIEISEEIKKMIDQNKDSKSGRDNEEHILQGDVILPPGLPENPDNIEGEIQEFHDEPLDGQVLQGEQVPQNPDFYQFKKIFYKECAVAGVSFHIEPNDELWDELEEGMEVALIRDKNNSHDKHAVAVAPLSDYAGDPEDYDFDFIFGYVPRTENKELATMMDAGYANKFSAKITTLKKYGNPNDRIRITIFIETNEKVLVRPNLLRAQSLSHSELEDLTEQLAQKGFYAARYGGYPHFDLQFPDKGERIVYVHETYYGAILYLMKVVAKDIDCLNFDVDDYESLDDCEAFVMTNIIGPIVVNKKENSFIAYLPLKEYRATSYLPKSVSKDFESLFNVELSNIINYDIPLPGTKE